MSFLDRVRACANFDPDKFLPFLVNGDHIGFVAPEFAEKLAAFGDVFAVSKGAVTLAPGLIGFAERTTAIDRALREIAEGGDIVGWRNEPFSVGPDVRGSALVLYGARRRAVVRCSRLRSPLERDRP